MCVYVCVCVCVCVSRYEPQPCAFGQNADNLYIPNKVATRPFVCIVQVGQSEVPALITSLLFSHIFSD